MQFCITYGLLPIPASQHTLCSYLAHLSNSLSPNSIKGYMNAIRLIHLEGGFQNPLSDNWELNMIHKGIHRLYGSPPKQKLPITVLILLDISRVLTDSPVDRAFWAACLIAFFGFLRKSTLLPSLSDQSSGKFISRYDVINLNLHSYNLQIRHSKTIQFGQRVLTLPYVRCDDHRLCPVRALLTHFGHSKLHGSYPLFDYVVSDTVKQFTHSFFMQKLRKILKQTGNNATDISCHSFRRGGATLAYQVGLSPVDIKLRGDWKSSAYERYLCIAPENAFNSAHSLCIGASRQSFTQV